MKELPHNHKVRWNNANARIDAFVAASSEANRPFLGMCVEQRRNAGHKPGSTLAWTRVAARFDAFVLGAPFKECQPDQYTRFLSSLREPLAPRSLRQVATHLKTAWRDLWDRDDMPRSFRKAMHVAIPRDAPAGELLSEAHFHDLLQESSALSGGSQGVPTATTWTALLWVLWDAGLRAKEALYLQVRDVELLPDGRALLHLRADGRPLKTGPRVVPVYDAVPALKGLLSVHPHTQGDFSPLFLNRRHKTTTGQMGYQAMLKNLHHLARESGVDGARPWDNRLTTHDFRHTCATRKARMGWQESEMRKFFGWFSGSRMAAYYVRLNYDDIAHHVARDAGLVVGLPSAPTIPADLVQLVASLVAKELAQR